MQKGKTRIVVWAEVYATIKARIRKNAARLEACHDEDRSRLLRRIQNDDFERLAIARDFIAWYRKPA